MGGNVSSSRGRFVVLHHIRANEYPIPPSIPTVEERMKLLAARTARQYEARTKALYSCSFEPCFPIN